MCLPLLIFRCTIKSRSSLLAASYPGGPGKRAVKRLWCGGVWLLTICWQALRALALIRLGRQDETTSTLQEVHALHPYDEHTLQAMAMCYRDVNRRTVNISR